MPPVEVHIGDICAVPSGYADGCELTFTDPPWEQGMVKMAETYLLRRAGIEPPGHTIDELLEHMFRLAPKDRPCYVEYSIKGQDRVTYWGQFHGHMPGQVWPIRQGNGRPCVLMTFNNPMPLPSYTPRIKEAIALVMGYHKPALVFEPFAGRGDYIAPMVKLGARVRGIEINPALACQIKGTA